MPERGEVRAFIVDNVTRLPRGLAQAAAERFSITRQAANRHIARLVDEGVLRAEGRTRNRVYRLDTLGRVNEMFPITEGLQEDVVWRDRVLPILASLPENVRDICSYGFTEILNNVKDHSASPLVVIHSQLTAATVRLGVLDTGIGIFKKIREAFRLEDERHAVLELAKGKLTTDPARHTGEGIFFTARMFDFFAISSGRLNLVAGRDANDFLIEHREEQQGTRVVMDVDVKAKHTTKDIFDRYSFDRDDYAFQRTHVVVSLAQAEDEKLVSRSQAKRIVARLDRFKEVILDFRRVDGIGPAFADEIFRVFRSTHPAVHLVVMNASDEVQKMIRRAESAAVG